MSHRLLVPAHPELVEGCLFIPSWYDRLTMNGPDRLTEETKNPDPWLPLVRQLAAVSSNRPCRTAQTTIACLDSTPSLSCIR